MNVSNEPYPTMPPGQELEVGGADLAGMLHADLEGLNQLIKVDDLR